MFRHVEDIKYIIIKILKKPVLCNAYFTWDELAHNTAKTSPSLSQANPEQTLKKIRFKLK